MADDDFKVMISRQWDDAIMMVDGKIRDVTRVRFFIGSHGPFEKTYDRGVDAGQIETDILAKQNELRRLSAL